MLFFEVECEVTLNQDLSAVVGYVSECRDKLEIGLVGGFLLLCVFKFRSENSAQCQILFAQKYVT